MKLRFCLTLIFLISAFLMVGFFPKDTDADWNLDFRFPPTLSFNISPTTPPGGTLYGNSATVSISCNDIGTGSSGCHSFQYVIDAWDESGGIGNYRSVSVQGPTTVYNPNILTDTTQSFNVQTNITPVAGYPHIYVTIQKAWDGAGNGTFEWNAGGISFYFYPPSSSAPTVDLKANGSDGPTNVNYNGTLPLSWTTTNNPTSCTATGAWSGSKAVGGGSEITGNLTASSYTYTIQCSNGSGTGPPDSVTINVAPSQPSMQPFISSGCSSGSPYIQPFWTLSSNTTSYWLFRHRVGDNTDTFIADVSDPQTTYADFTVVTGNQYYYYVFAVNAAGQTQASNTTSTITATGPCNLAVSCSGSPSSVTTGQNVTWTAIPSGGSGSYTSYAWTGTDSLSGTFASPSISKTYSTAGTETANVTVYDSINNSASANCSNSVTVNSSAPSCSFTGPSSLTVNQPGTFTSTSTGSITSHSWTSSPAGGTFVSPISSSSDWSASAAGTYVITLNVTGPGGSAACSNSLPNPPGGTVVGTQPDLIVDTLSSSPSSPIVGSSMSFSGRVFNQGGSSAGSSSTRLSIDGNTISPDAATSVLATNTGSAANWSSVWTATTGTHTFQICADIDGVVGESNEGNNCSSTTFTVAAIPTCSFTGPSALSVGQSGTFTFTGSGATSYSFTSSPAGGTFVSPISSSSDWSASAAGTYVITLNVTGPGGSAACSNSLPNPPGGTVVSPQPDLIIHQLFLSDPNPTVGEAITFFGGAKNQGGANAPGSSARFCLDNPNCLTNTTGRVGSDLSVSALPAGSGSSVIGPVPWTATGVSHIIYLCADVNNVVLESDETNNCSQVSFTVTAPPSLPDCSFSYTGSSPLTVGQSGTFNQISTANTTSWSWTSSPSGGTFVSPFSSSSSWSASAAGTYVITLDVTGPGGSSTCSNSLPNPPGGTIVSSLPDLIVPSTPLLNSGTLNVGTPITFRGTIQNIGGLVAGGTFNNQFQIDPRSSFNPADPGIITLSPHPTITALGVNNSQQVISASWTPGVAGTYTLRLCADQPSPAVGESNEGNNCDFNGVNVDYNFNVAAAGGILPWIQTTNGDVHSNTTINTPGGP